MNHFHQHRQLYRYHLLLLRWHRRHRHLRCLKYDYRHQNLLRVNMRLHYQHQVG